LTKHAQKVLDEREIRIEWLERTLSAPELVLLDPDAVTVERRFRRIPEFGGRVLRVAVNTAVDPNRVVSVFFDRRMKGKL
jgi:capsule polysaccharide modification protein KpsS